MGRCDAPKRVRHRAAEDLPDDLVHVIFAKLDFKTKVIAGLVCKRWDQLLKVPIAGARHWVVKYNVDTVVSRQAFTSAEELPIVEQSNATIERWLINRAAAIKVVRVSASIFSDEQGDATLNVLESQLPLLAGCLAKHVNRLELDFDWEFPFASPLLSSSAFLTSLCPMVKTFSLRTLKVLITATQFAAICELSSLEKLHIETDEVDEPGLQEMTSDISSLVNLKTLILSCNLSQGYIPESISCLQKLEDLKIVCCGITEVPSGLARLANLSSLEIRMCGPLRFPPSLQGLKSLTRVYLEECSLEAIPEVLTGLSALTCLKLNEDDLHSNDEGWSWWPTTLSRLSKLAKLALGYNHIVSLPPHISGLRQLTKLDVCGNSLRSFPEQLSCLENLRDLQAAYNHIPTVPVSVLSKLTALTSISLCYQHLEGNAEFKVSSTLLPILHPGLVELDLTHHCWDVLSLRHLLQAMADVADRRPMPTLRFSSAGRR